MELIHLLNKALEIEYSDIFLYPRHSDLFKGFPAIQQLFNNFALMELRHADTLAFEITKLGGKPVWDFNLLTGKKTRSEVIDWHLAHERTAIKHYRRCIAATYDKRLREILDGIRVEESIHENALVKFKKWL